MDGNTSDYSSELDAGLLEGSKGTIPGVNPSDDFVKRLESTGVDLKNTTTYGAETYDGIILAALAAQKGGSADGKTIQANMAAVSGSTKGEKCDSYKACVALLKDGKEISTRGRPPSARSTTRMIRAQPPSASISTTPTISRSSTTPRKAPCRRPDAQRLAVLSGRTMKETVRRKRWQSQAPRRLFHMRNARLSCPERGFTGYFRRRRRGVG